MLEHNVDIQVRRLSNNARKRGKRFEDLIFNLFGSVLIRNKDGALFDGMLNDNSKFVEIKSVEEKITKKKRNGRIKFSKNQIDYIKEHPNEVLLFLVLHKNGRIRKIYQIEGKDIPIHRQVSWKNLINGE